MRPWGAGPPASASAMLGAGGWIAIRGSGTSPLNGVGSPSSPKWFAHAAASAACAARTGAHAETGEGAYGFL